MVAPNIGVINLGIGNIRSVLNMLSYLHISAIEVTSPTDLGKPERLILPGVGHFDRAAEALSLNGWKGELENIVLGQKKPLLGVCLGMQILSYGSEEGKGTGLGWIPAHFKKFKFESHQHFRVPHMGWNTIQIVNDHYLLSGLDNARFYFVHSYYGVCENDENILATTTYSTSFVSVYQRDSLVGVQFHPEKSHKFGMQLLKNFSQGPV